MIACAIVLADGQPLASEVLSGISKQTTDIQIFPITRPFECYEEEDTLRGYKSTCESRNIARDILLSQTFSKYALFMDSDVVLEDKNTVARMIQLLDRDPKLGACAVHTKIDTRSLDQVQKGEDKHICMACVMIRKEVLSKIKFRNAEHNTCNCLYMTRDINDIRYRTKYVTPMVAYEIDHERNLFSHLKDCPDEIHNSEGFELSVVD